jgi:hypothetical protein
MAGRMSSKVVLVTPLYRRLLDAPPDGGFTAQ